MSTTTDITDDELVARMRAALDELTASPANEIRLIGSARSAAARRRPKLVMAAAAVIIIGAVSAIAVNRAGREDAPAASAPVATVPAALPSTTTPVAPSAAAVDWYVLAGTDLVAAPITFEAGSLSGESAPAHVMVWQIEPSGLLFARAATRTDVPDLDVTGWGIDEANVLRLRLEIVPGSGLPYVLPVPEATLLGSGLDTFGELHGQVYSSDDGSVRLSSGSYRGRLAEMADATDGAMVEVAGASGYRFTGDDGTVHVMWRTPNGFWAALDIDPGLAGRTDELIASVRPADDGAAPGATETTVATDVGAEQLDGALTSLQSEAPGVVAEQVSVVVGDAASIPAGFITTVRSGTVTIAFVVISGDCKMCSHPIDATIPPTHTVYVVVGSNAVGVAPGDRSADLTAAFGSPVTLDSLLATTSGDDG